MLSRRKSRVLRQLIESDDEIYYSDLASVLKLPLGQITYIMSGFVNFSSVNIDIVDNSMIKINYESDLEKDILSTELKTFFDYKYEFTKTHIIVLALFGFSVLSNILLTGSSIIFLLVDFIELVIFYLIFKYNKIGYIILIILLSLNLLAIFSIVVNPPISNLDFTFYYLAIAFNFSLLVATVFDFERFY